MKAILVLVAAMGFAASPFLTAGFTGFTPDQFPIPQNDPPVQPAGYAFAIWGLIYLWLIIGAGYGLLKRDEAPDWAPMRWPLIVSLGVGISWSPVANLDPISATVMIWGMLVTALAALLRAGLLDRLVHRTPIALYAGWLTAAACVALGIVLAGYGWLDAQIAAYLCIGLALVIGMTVQSLRPDTPEYSAALIWALAGIIVANIRAGNIEVTGLAGLGILMLAGRGILAR